MAGEAESSPKAEQSPKTEPLQKSAKADAKEFQKELTRAITENKLVVGSDRVIKLISSKKASFVAFASNCPDRQKLAEMAGKSEIKHYDFPGTNVDLGELCKKPFRVAALAIKAQ